MNLHAIAASSSSFWVQFGAPLANHLWQSTVFAGVVWLLTLSLRKSRAGARYALWLIASAKFLLPFSLLISFGSRLAWAKAPATSPALFVVTQVLSEPFNSVHPASVAHFPESPLAALVRLLPFLLLIVWSCGCGAVLFRWWRRRRLLIAALRRALPVQTGRELEVLRRLEQSTGMTRQIALKISQIALEPGILGIFHPVLLLPSGISERLNDAQLEAIITHELCHVRRRDNLAAALHMLVEALFWFHPLLWWMGGRLVDERERACDEDVLRLGADPHVYAESILKVCKFYLESPLFCAAGVTGSNLKKRIEAIMTNRIAPNLQLGKKLFLAAAGAAAVIAPMAFGLVHATQSSAQSQGQAAVGPALAFKTASVKPNKTDEPPPEFSIVGKPFSAVLFKPNRFMATNVTLHELIRVAYGVQDSQIVGGPEWLNSEKYDVDATIGSPVVDQLSKLSDEGAGIERGRMLQAFLADRFKLALHRQTRELPSYALVIAQGGPKLQVAKPGDTYPNGMKDGNGRPLGAGIVVEPEPGKLVGQGVPVAVLVGELSQHYLDRTVVDKTGLTANYDFSLQWSPHTSQGTDHTPPILIAIRDQLGLTLESQSNPVEVLVVDRAERATPNEPGASRVK